MFGRRYNLFMQHALYRGLPHREGGGVPRNVATGHYDREAVRAQLRRELKSIRNRDMFTHFAAHVVRLHARKAPGAAPIPGCILARADARPPVKASAALMVASLRYRHRMEPAARSTTAPSPSALPTRAPQKAHRSISRRTTATTSRTRRRGRRRVQITVRTTSVSDQRK